MKNVLQAIDISIEIHVNIDQNRDKRVTSMKELFVLKSIVQKNSWWERITGAKEFVVRKNCWCKIICGVKELLV